MGFIRKESEHTVHQPEPASEVDRLALELCPAEEVKRYYQNTVHFALLKPGHVKVFPVWKRYRRQAERIFAVRRLVPLLRKAPLQWSDVAARILLKDE